ncbi:MAG: DUF711 family protein [candidate division WOR-3 bacterium]
MKIRSITLFYNFKEFKIKKNLIEKIENIKKIYNDAIRKNFTVQTLRLSTNIASLNTDFLTKISIVRDLQEILKEQKIEFFNVGKVNTLEINKTMKLFEKFNVSAFFEICTGSFDEKSVIKGAKLIKELSYISPLKNFNFGISFNIISGTPFFPSSFSIKDGFSIGFENGDILQNIFKNVKNFSELENTIEKNLYQEYKIFENFFEKEAKKRNLEFLGLDLSFAPGIKKSESVYEAFYILKRNIKRKNINDISIAGAITTTLKNLKIKKTGYCGLMLPLSEDYRLSKMSFDNNIRIKDLLLLSSVCGCGIDTVPISTDSKNEFIESLIIDSYTISRKWKKPLQLRILPVHNQEIVKFNSKYLLKTKFLEY